MRVLQSAEPANGCRGIRKAAHLHRIVTHPGFALVNLFLVLASGVVWILIPGIGIWFTLLALLASGALFLSDRSLLKRIPYTWFLAVFMITAVIGYWAAYD